MRLIYLSHCLPFPPNKGDRVRAFHALRVLASAGHEIHLLALAKPGEKVEDGRALQEFCDRVEVFPLGALSARLRSLRALVGSRALTHAYFHCTPLLRRVAEIERSEAFDAVVAYSSAMIPYAMRLRRGPRVLDMVDVDSEKWSQYASTSGLPQRRVFAIEARRLRRVEEEACESFDSVVVATQREESMLESISRAGRYRKIRNGVAPEFFEAEIAPKSVVPTLSFTGQMDYLPNIDAAEFLARAVLPRLQDRFPSLRLLIVGRSPAPRVRQLARLSGVQVTGAVEDVRPYLAESWIFVAPLRVARGIQNKVLEAMAMGLPVVCSSGVQAGLSDGGFREREDLRVGDSEDEIAGAIGELLEDRGMRARLAKSARSRVRAVYDWDRNMTELAHLLEELLPSPADTHVVASAMSDDSRMGAAVE